MVEPLWRTVWRLFKTRKRELPCDPAIPLLGIFPEKIPMLIAALFTIARTWRQPRCPSIDEWIKKIWYMYLMEYS